MLCRCNIMSGRPSTGVWGVLGEHFTPTRTSPSGKWLMAKCNYCADWEHCANSTRMQVHVWRKHRHIVDSVSPSDSASQVQLCILSNPSFAVMEVPFGARLTFFIQLMIFHKFIVFFKKILNNKIIIVKENFWGWT